MKGCPAPVSARIRMKTHTHTHIPCLITTHRDQAGNDASLATVQHRIVTTRLLSIVSKLFVSSPGYHFLQMLFSTRSPGPENYFLAALILKFRGCSGPKNLIGILGNKNLVARAALGRMGFFE